MPTINSAVTLESFIHRNGGRNKKPTNHSAPAQQVYILSNQATPEFVRGPFRDSSPDSDSDTDPRSPYLTNRKRRVPSPPVPYPQEIADAGGPIQQLPDATLELDDDDEFFDPRESRSVATRGSDTEDRLGPRHGGSFRRGGSESGHSDYYDAVEDSFSDGSFPGSPFSFNIIIERELQALKCNLIEEVEKRKKAEMELLQTYKQCGEIQECLFRLGLSYHETEDSGNVNMPDPAEVCQAIIYSRFVSDAVERDLAQAESEEVSEAILTVKDHEISRLRDRLQYYEAVNHEMSQRNQEAVESARQRQLRRKTRRRWIWGFVGLSITIGASLLAYSYSPLSVKAPLPTSSLNASSVSMTSSPDASSLSMTSSPDASSLSMTTSVETEGCCLGD